MIPEPSTWFSFGVRRQSLLHGVTGFAFISGLSSKDNPSFPIVFGPLIPGTETPDVKWPK